MTVGKQVGLFVVQCEVAPADADTPDGIWATATDEIYSNDEEANAAIAGLRGEERYFGDECPCIYRVVQLGGVVVSVDVPQPDEDD